MKKIFIPSAGISVDICTDGCGGIFFDNQELQKFDKQSSDASLIEKELEGKSFVKVDESQTRVCPVCNRPMAKTSIRGLGIEIDTCYTCGAVFLDNGELAAIRKGVRTTSIDTVKAQNSQLNDQMVRQLFKEAQKEEYTSQSVNNLLKSVSRRSSFGCGRSRYRGYGLFDLLWDIFS